MTITVKKHAATLLALFAFFAAIIFPLAYKSQLWIDEVLDSDPGYNLAFNNRMALSVWEGLRVEEHFFMRPPVGYMVLATLYKTFGFKRWVTLSLSLIPAILSFCLTYLIAFYFTREYAASVLSSVLFGLSPLGMLIAKWARVDALALFFFCLSLICLLASERKRVFIQRALIILSAIFIGLSIQTYQLYGLLLLGYFAFFIQRLIRKQGGSLANLLFFTFSLSLTLLIWLKYIMQDLPLFIAQNTHHILRDTGITDLYNKGYLVNTLKAVLFSFMENSAPTVIFIILGVIFLAKRLPLYRELSLSFILLPALGLFFLNILRGNYIEIILPLGYVGAGFLAVRLIKNIKNSYYKNSKKLIIIAILILFFISHLAVGVLARYFVVIKDWRIRDLGAYEKQIAANIPAGSNVLGGPENWYVLCRNGSKLFLLSCLYHKDFNMDKIDYVVLPGYHRLESDPALAKFIGKKCSEIARIGKHSYGYYLLDNNRKESGYGSVIYRVIK